MAVFRFKREFMRNDAQGVCWDKILAKETGPVLGVMGSW